MVEQQPNQNHGSIFPNGASSSSMRATGARRGLMLVVVLVMVVLLSLLAAGYTLMVRAHIDGVTTQVRQFKIRMAAESGVQQAVNTLRYTRGDVDTWYNNPELYRSYLVQGPEGEEASSIITDQGETEVKLHDPTADEAFRFTLFAPNFDDPTHVRYGFTDESARLDLNSATETQLRTLFTTLIPENQDYPVDFNVLVDSLLDWRDQGDAARPNGAKSAYYQTLDPPYSAKSAEFSSVEELLLVRGFTPWVVFGEDYNQNGLLDPNEDDGEESFPLDDANGVLYRGVAPYLTVWSQEANISGDNRARINLNMEDTQKLQEKLEAEFDGDLVSYIIGVRSAGIRFNSVMNLLPAPEPDEEDATSQPGDEGDPSTQPSDGSGDPSTQPGGGTIDPNDGASDPNDPNAQPQDQPRDEQTESPAQKDEDDPTSQPFGKKDERSKQVSADQGRTDEESENQRLEELREQLIQNDPTQSGAIPQEQQPPTSQPGQQPPATSQPVYTDLTGETPPGTYEDLPLILDRLTANPSPVSSGRINVSTAPREVLMMLEELAPAQVEAIVTARQTLDSATKSSPAWLVTQGVISEYRFRRILEKITTKSSVYRIEAVGFADNVGIVERYMVILQMRGPVPQVLYYRNLNPLGMAYRPHGEEMRLLSEQ
ncbi:MAG TPA: hypothetical protein VNT79_02595 [Phycisphaerae bacterium]|nr:hypothetical protein [Phycisphaerae bacterium]